MATKQEKTRALIAQKLNLDENDITPEDVANVALFLASDLSSYVTGQMIHCCGGMNC